MATRTLTTKDELAIERECENCSKRFYPKPNTQGRFCSKQCHWALDRKNYRGKHIEGYIMVYPHKLPYPGARRDGRILEHRYVMQEYLGRPLMEYETVHHINGDKTDNRLENLELWSGRHGRGTRVEDPPHCATCQCGRA